MIDPIAASSAADGAHLASTVARPKASTRGGASFAGELARYVASTPDSATAAARPKNEKLAKVDGHPFSRIENGSDKGLYLNQLDNSPREGKVFKLVERDNRVFHVYGSGKDKVVVEVKSKAKNDSTTTQPTGGTTPSTTPSTSTSAT
jgi:hypothetical protein